MLKNKDNNYDYLQSSYKDDYQNTKEKNKYKMVDTELYKVLKDGEKCLSDVSLTFYSG